MPELTSSNTEAISLTESQTEIWLASQMDINASLAFNESFTVNLKGPFNVAAMQEAIQCIYKRHDIFHISFSNNLTFNQSRQRKILDIPVFDFSSLDEECKDSEISSFLSSEASTPFDLSSGPLLRIKIIIISPDSHELIFCAHHLIMDGWSKSVFLKEIGMVYTSICTDTATVFKEAASFCTYAEQLNKNLPSEESIISNKYWLEQFSEIPAQLILPADHPRTNSKSYSGSMHKHPLCIELSSSIITFAKKCNSTLHSLMLSVYAVLLYRLTGQNNIVIGVPFSGQALSGNHDLIGSCVHLLPIYLSLSGNMTCKDVIAAVKRQVLDAFDHSHITYGTIVKQLKIPREQNRPPLINITFNFSFDVLQGVCFHKLEANFNEGPKKGVNFDLHLNIENSKGILVLDFVYSTDLFENDTIQRWSRYFQMLMQEFIDNPDRKIEQLNLISKQEMSWYNDKWNNTFKKYPSDVCLHHMFESQVLKTPDKKAITFIDKSYTYFELNNLANKIANKLQLLNVKPDVSVGICCERSMEMVIGLVAILKAGGAYVPIDPELPLKRISILLKDISTPVVLTQKKFSSLFPENESTVICLDAEIETLNAIETKNINSGVNSDNIAYIIFTSGSTGTPKGVMIPHKGICNRLLWMQDEYQLTAKDIVLQKTPFSFDVSVWEIFWPLLNGATLHIASPGGHKDPSYLIDEITKREITIIHFVPTMLHEFLEHPSVSKCISLRHTICSGEALPHSLMTKYLKTLPSRLHNLYGPTEASVDVTFWECRCDYSDYIVPIGKPISNIQMHILDNDLNILPIGIPGELYIGGIGVASGYLNQPTLTAEKFLKDPFLKGGVLYKTGDLASRLSDGNISFLGRKDFQFKFNGLRIEPGEIEAAIESYPKITRALVKIKNYNVNTNILYAYYSTSDNKPIETRYIKAFLKENLPSYMVPSILLHLEKIPFNKNGKIDQSLLPEPTLDKGERETSFTLPENQTQQAILDIWKSVLNTKDIGINDNIFDIGGHSVILIKILIEIQKTFHKAITITDLFQYTTIATLSTLLTDGEKHLEKNIEFHEKALKSKQFQIKQKNMALKRIPPQSH